MSRLCEEFKIVPVIQPKDHQAAAKTGDSICMKNYSHCTFIVSFGQLTGDSILKVREGATDGATTADVTFSYRYADAAITVASADILGTEATSAALTLSNATYEDRMLIIEIDAAEMTDGYDWLTIYIDDTSTEMFASVVAILTPKYAGAALHTALYN